MPAEVAAEVPSVVLPVVPWVVPWVGQEKEEEQNITGSNGGAPATVHVTPPMRGERVS